MYDSGWVWGMVWGMSCAIPAECFHPQDMCFWSVLLQVRELLLRASALLDRSLGIAAWPKGSAAHCFQNSGTLCTNGDQEFGCRYQQKSEGLDVKPQEVSLNTPPSYCLLKCPRSFSESHISLSVQVPKYNYKLSTQVLI